VVLCGFGSLVSGTLCALFVLCFMTWGGPGSQACAHESMRTAHNELRGRRHAIGGWFFYLAEEQLICRHIVFFDLCLLDRRSEREGGREGGRERGGREEGERKEERKEERKVGTMK